MSEKSEMQSYAESILNQHKIRNIHVPNRAFGNKYRTPENLKQLPDLIFTYNNKLYMREFGLKGQHLDRKEKQLQVMLEWQKQAPGITDIRLIWSRAELEEDFKKIGLLT